MDDHSPSTKPRKREPRLVQEPRVHVRWEPAHGEIFFHLYLQTHLRNCLDATNDQIRESIEQYRNRPEIDLRCFPKSDRFNVGYLAQYLPALRDTRNSVDYGPIARTQKKGRIVNGRHQINIGFVHDPVAARILTIASEDAPYGSRDIFIEYCHTRLGDFKGADVAIPTQVNWLVDNRYLTDLFTPEARRDDESLLIDPLAEYFDRAYAPHPPTREATNQPEASGGKQDDSTEALLAREHVRFGLKEESPDLDRIADQIVERLVRFFDSRKIAMTTTKPHVTSGPDSSRSHIAAELHIGLGPVAFSEADAVVDSRPQVESDGSRQPRAAGDLAYLARSSYGKPKSSSDLALISEISDIDLASTDEEKAIPVLSELRRRGTEVKSAIPNVAALCTSNSAKVRGEAVLCLHAIDGGSANITYFLFSLLRHETEIEVRHRLRRVLVSHENARTHVITMLAETLRNGPLEEDRWNAAFCFRHLPPVPRVVAALEDVLLATGFQQDLGVAAAASLAILGTCSEEALEIINYRASSDNDSDTWFAYRNALDKIASGKPHDYDGKAAWDYGLGTPATNGR